MTEKVRLGSVGLGWWGATLAQAAEASGDAEIVAAFARTPSSREEFAERFSCRAAESLDALLADESVDGILVATPHSTHAAIIEAAAEAGKHVFVEKPLTLNYREGLRAVETAEKHGIVLQVGHHRRRQPATRRLRQLLEDGELGQVSLLESNLSGKSNLTPRSGWRGDRDESPLGSMTGMGVHMADNLIYLVGPAKSVTALSTKTLARGPLDDVSVVGLEFANGVLGHIGTSHVVPKTSVTAVFGSEGAAWSEEEGQRLFRQSIDETSRSEVEVQGPDALKDQMNAFAGCIRDGRKPEMDGRQALEVVAVLEAAVRSQERRQTVEVDEVRD